MRILKLTLSLGAAVVALAATGAVQAAPITWDPATSIGWEDPNSDLQVSTNGVQHTGASLGDVAVTAVVNGVSFQPGDGGGTLSYDGGKVTVSAAAFAYGGLLPMTSGNASYDELLSRSMGGNPAETLTVNSLTVGDDYEIQIWANDSRQIAAVWNRNTTVQDQSGGAQLTLLQNKGVNFVDNMGEFAIGTFTADAASQILDVSGNAGYILTAVQVRNLSVPEPTSLVLGLASLCMGLFVTRRRVA